MKSIIEAASCMAIALAAVSCSSNNNANQSNQNQDMKSKVLVVVDVQRDFFDPSGSLYVGGSEVLPARIAGIAESYDAVIFTLDWHPGNHCSFADFGGQWPSHCVAYTQGAGLPDEFAPVLASGKARIFLKGQEQDKEQYGAFEDLDPESIEYSWLSNADSIDVCGIAGDYCVKESCGSVLKVAAPEKVSILMDCVRSIDGGEALEAFISEKGISKK